MIQNVCRAAVRLAIAGLCAGLPITGDGFTGRGSWPGPWASEAILSPDERRELERRRAVVEARAGELAERLAGCGHLRSRVRESLMAIQRVHAVHVGLALLTSHPPRMPVTFAITLDSGRVVWDRLTVVVPVRPTVVPLGGSGSPVGPLCASAGP